jgi:hypothetical protein
VFGVPDHHDWGILSAKSGKGREDFLNQ